MFGLRPKLPVTADDRVWIDESFVHLERLLGRNRMLEARVIELNDSCFPDPFNGSHESAVLMANRIAGYLGISPETFQLVVYAEGEDSWREGLPANSPATKDAAGLYLHKPEDGRFVVGIHAKNLKEPDSLAGTLAHELAHVLLLGGRLLAPEAPGMEPLTDLCTVFLGLGVVTSASAFRFAQWNEGAMQGWSTSSTGYLNQQQWGYALARFAHERQEAKPVWRKSLTVNIRNYFDQSAKWLRAT